ncbi:MAG: protein phosphatase 2C domain-containing protein [Ignavibacteriaceae bacterium]|nr:protein phosphatase 2C domain-containing protein [Ignavibacteriaceae bacterium]
MSDNFISLTDVGRKRKLNEDSVRSEIVADASSPIETVLLVADGMGGHKAGEIASHEAENIIIQFFVYGEYKKFAQKVGINPGELKQVLQEVIFYIDKKIKNVAQTSHSEKGMGTTLTVALILKTNGAYRDVLIGHVGDSRAYIISSSGIKLITADDSLVWKYYTRGMITYEEMRTHPEKNVITQALGGDTLEKPQVFMERLKDDSMLFLCSDGLHGMLNDKQIFQICRSSTDPEKISTLLIDYANKAGGKDNISVALYSRSFRTIKVKKPVMNVPMMAIVIVLLIAVLGTVGYFVSSLIPERIDPPPIDNNPTGPDQGLNDWNGLTIRHEPEDKRIEVGEKIVYTLDFQSKDTFDFQVKFDGIKQKTPDLSQRKDFEVTFKNHGGGKTVEIKVINLKTGKDTTIIDKYEVTKANKPPDISFNWLEAGIVELDGIINEIESINWESDKTDREKLHKYSDKGKAINAKIKVKFKNGTSGTYKPKIK